MKTLESGRYVEFIETDGGNLELVLTDEGREELDGREWSDSEAIWELAEDIFCNSEWALIRPDDIGALTSCDVILTNVADLDEDSGAYTPADGARVWWHERYQIESLRERLQETGRVLLRKGD